jgi:hypothetical protein
MTSSLTVSQISLSVPRSPKDDIEDAYATLPRVNHKTVKCNIDQYEKLVPSGGMEQHGRLRQPNPDVDLFQATSARL